GVALIFAGIGERVLVFRDLSGFRVEHSDSLPDVLGEPDHAVRGRCRPPRTRWLRRRGIDRPFAGPRIVPHDDVRGHADGPYAVLLIARHAVIVRIFVVGVGVVLGDFL